VCILDADKEGFLRNETSLIQTAGRAARHISGECVLFCDVMTESIRRLIEVSDERRTRQRAHNEAHGITPQGVKRGLQQSLQAAGHDEGPAAKGETAKVAQEAAPYDPLRVIAGLEEEMRAASARLEFERAAHLRDQIAALKQPADAAAPRKTEYPKAVGKRGKRRGT